MLKHSLRFFLLPLIGFFLSIFLFCMMYDSSLLNPTYDQWILDGGDFQQHYLGWIYYRNTPWRFPIGLLDGLSSDGAVSCIYTDSIPLFAVFFKLLSPLLPDTFQYFGLWGAFSFGMMGFCSVVLLQKFSRNPIFCLSGSICFTYAPSLLIRMYGHEALAGQWVIVAAIVLWAYQYRTWKHPFTPAILWAILAATAVMIHMYFVPMVFLVMMGALLDCLIREKNWKYPMLTGILSIASVLTVMAVLGAFYGESSFSAGGFGLYSANLLSLLNPEGRSSILQKLPVCDGQQLEGFSYLGFGILATGIMVILLFVHQLEQNGTKKFRTWAAAHKSTLIGATVCYLVVTIWATSNVVTFGSKVLFTIPLPRLILGALNIFRASGRLLWVALYLIYTAVFFGISKLNAKKTTAILACFCCGLQLLDLREMIAGRHASYQIICTEYKTGLKDPGWEAAAEGTTEIIFLPLPPDYLKYLDIYMPISWFAAAHDLRLSSYYLARCKYDNLAAYAQAAYDELSCGGGREDVLYVFFNKEDVPDCDHLTVYEMDGITAARVSNQS